MHCIFILIYADFNACYSKRGNRSRIQLNSNGRWKKNFENENVEIQNPRRYINIALITSIKELPYDENLSNLTNGDIFVVAKASE